MFSQTGDKKVYNSNTRSHSSSIIPAIVEHNNRCAECTSNKTTPLVQTIYDNGQVIFQNNAGLEFSLSRRR